MIKKCLFLLFFTLHPLLEGGCFKDIFYKGNIGDYSIYQNDDLVTIISIHGKSKTTITLEEITLPKSTYKNIKGLDLNNWVKNGAATSTSWTMMEIDIDSLEILEAYCFTRRAHLCLQKEDTIISALLGLDVTKLTEKDLPRIGPRKGSSRDNRPFWRPQMTVNGKKLSPKTMDVYRGRWAKDHSILSQKRIDLYLLDNFVFPYWIKVQSDVASRKMISLDSGRNFCSPIEEIPSQPPTFLSNLLRSEEDNNYFYFLLKAGHTMSDYTVHLMEVAKNKNILLKMEATFKQAGPGMIEFNLLSSDLKNTLSSERKYRLYISYLENNEVKSIVSKNIIHWK